MVPRCKKLFKFSDVWPSPDWEPCSNLMSQSLVSSCGFSAEQQACLTSCDGNFGVTARHTGRVQDGDNRWSMGPLYSVQSLRLRSSFFIREYATTVEPSAHIDFTSQPQKDARGRCVPFVGCGVEACTVNAHPRLQTSLTALQ